MNPDYRRSSLKALEREVWGDAIVAKRDRARAQRRHRRQRMATRASCVVVAVTVGVVALASTSFGAPSSNSLMVWACVRSDGYVRADTVRIGKTPPASCPATTDSVVSWTVNGSFV